MASSKSAKRPHLHIDTDSDSDVDRSIIYFPRFIVLESVEETPLSRLSPFDIKRFLGTTSRVEPKNVKTLRNGTLLVQVTTKAKSDALLKMTLFDKTKIKSYPHQTLNSSKGVVRCRQLSLCTLDEIKSNLKQQGVSDVRRISIKRNDQIINTNTYIFTFDTPTIPTELKIGYNIAKVEVYVPNPLRCFGCQRFGHHEDKCNNKPTCRKCGMYDSDHSEYNCARDVRCSNCQGQHTADSKDCPVWQREKEIMRVKYTQNISFPEARKIVQPSTQSYASVTKKSGQLKENHLPTASVITMLDIISKLKPEDVPSAIADLKASLSESESLSPSQPPRTTKATTTSSIAPLPKSVPSGKPAGQISPPVEGSSNKEALPQREKPRKKSPVREELPPNRSIPRQRSTPRQKIQVEPNSIPTHNKYEGLEEMDVEDKDPRPSKSSKHKPHK